jgi:fructuronate reductase
VTDTLSRAAGHGRPAPPVRLVHLGLGNFFRAHQAWYTDQAPDAEQWGIAAFEGRGSGLAQTLRTQDGLFTLVTRAATGDRFDVIGSVSRAHAADDHGTWLDYLASPQVCAVTVTITEAGYLRGADGGLDRSRNDVQADVAVLRHDPTARVRTAPARLVAGLAARRRTEAGPLTLIPCDNLPDNGAVTAQVLADLADLVDPGLADWIDGSLSMVTTMVDRITPRTTPEDIVAVSEGTGLRDDAPVVTEPFREWVLSGAFPVGRPRWEDAGATFTGDITPFEHRKLWLLNGGHSLLAYAGAIRGHDTVADAVADDTVRGWLLQWWTEASRHLTQGEEELAAYRNALLDRFANPRIRYLLAQIATDGSQKLPVRILPTLRRERAAGRTPAGATLLLGAWVAHLRGAGTPVVDVRADEIVPLAGGPLPDAVRQVVTYLDPALGADGDVVSAVLEAAEQLTDQSRA